MNIVITWPRTRTLESYIEECARASDQGLQINFRVPSRPKVYAGERCYVVYEGEVRGWHEVIAVGERDDVIDPTTGEGMRPGLYVVRDPSFNPWYGDAPVEVRGFQGWRYARSVPGLS